MTVGCCWNGYGGELRPYRCGAAAGRPTLPLRRALARMEARLQEGPRAAREARSVGQYSGAMYADDFSLPRSRARSSCGWSVPTSSTCRQRRNAMASNPALWSISDGTSLTYRNSAANTCRPEEALRRLFVEDQRRCSRDSVSSVSRATTAAEAQCIAE